MEQVRPLRSDGAEVTRQLPGSGSSCRIDPALIGAIVDPQARIDALEIRNYELLGSMHDIVTRADRERRELRPDEAKRLKTAEDEHRENGGKVADLLRERSENAPRRQIAPEQGDRSNQMGGGDREARPSVILAKDARMADWQAGRPTRSSFTARDAGDFSIGRAVQGMITGRWEGAELERRALAEGVGASGGFLTPEPLAAEAIDRVRNRARVIEAGARTVPMTSDTLSIPRLATGVTAAWRTENTAVAESDPAFERVTFTARTLAVQVKLSYELAEDMSPESADLITDELTAALSLELDRVALRGTGTAPEPRGIRNQTGVEVQAHGGANGAALTNYDPLIAAAAGVQADNHEASAAILSSRTAASLATLKTGITGDNTPLTPPPYLANLRLLVSNQIPVALTVGTSTDTTELYTGDFSQLLIGVRPSIGVRLVRSAERHLDTLSHLIVAYLRADIQLQHPAAFVVTTGIRP